MLTPVPLKQIVLTDKWFKHYRDLTRDVIIPYQWAAIHDEIEGVEPSHSVANLTLAAKKLRGESVNESFSGFIFQDSDPMKWIEAAAYQLASEPYLQSELKNHVEELIDLLAAAQCEDGYLNSYFTLENPDKRWKNLADCHELYVAGHLIEAACAYYYATDERKLLGIAIRFADLIERVFGPGERQIHGYPGHEEIELALVKLFNVTNEQKYLNLAAYFISERGKSPNYFLSERRSEEFFSFYPGSENVEPHLPYHQADVPVRDQEHAEGHAVRATYLYCAMADVAELTQDKILMGQTIKLWNDITQHQMYVTGGIGQSGILERFTCPDDLPNDANYSETCAGVGLALFSLRLGLYTGKAHYHDIVELELFNGIASGVSNDGTAFFYVNPMEVWPDNCMEHTSRGHVKAKRQNWFPCACCPPNLARTYAGLGQYLLSQSEDEIFIQQYIAHKTKLKQNGQWVSLNLTGDYALQGLMRLEVTSTDGVKLALRIPDWCHNFTIDGVNAQNQEDGYYHFIAKAGVQAYELDFHPEAEFVIARPEVRADRGLTSMRRGPLIYAVESCDNGANLSELLVNPEIKPEFRVADLPTISVKGVRERYLAWPEDKLYRHFYRPIAQDTEIIYIPYAFWGNRDNEHRENGHWGNEDSKNEAGEMRVWLRYIAQGYGGESHE